MPKPAPGFLGATLMVAALPLAAQTWEDPPIHFGLQATLARPAQDLQGMVAKQGQGGGFFFEQDAGEDVRVRARFDYLTFGQGRLGPRNPLPSFIPPQALAMDADQASLGFEVRYAPALLHGFFMLGGLSASRFEFGSLVPGETLQDPLVHLKEKTSTKACLALGLGYRITRSLSATARYTTLTLNGNALSTVEAGLDFRF